MNKDVMRMPYSLAVKTEKDKFILKKTFLCQKKKKNYSSITVTAQNLAGGCLKASNKVMALKRPSVAPTLNYGARPHDI